jgi:hypothetical protein
MCDTLDLTVDTRTGVLKAKKEIEQILEFRKSGGPAEVSRLIDKLDDSSFQTRETAAKALEAFGIMGELALTEALSRPQSAETRTRIRRILDRIQSSPTKLARVPVGP